MVVTKPKKIRLGDLLVEHKIITQEQLNIALENQKSSGQKLGRVLIDKGFISEDKLLDFLAHQLKISADAAVAPIVTPPPPSPPVSQNTPGTITTAPTAVTQMKLSDAVPDKLASVTIAIEKNGSS